MSSRSKDKVAAALRKIFRSSDKMDRSGPDGGGVSGSVSVGATGATGNGVGPRLNNNNNNNNDGNGALGSPALAARRLLSRATGCRDGGKVSPADASPGAGVVGLGVKGSKTSGLFLFSTKGRHSEALQQPLALQQQQPLQPQQSHQSHHGRSRILMSESSVKHAKVVRTRRLMKEFQEIQRSQNESALPVFTVELVNDSLFEWSVKLLRIDTESDLYRDMREMNVAFIQLQLHFPENFPFAPPFMRVISPRIEKGFVMEGGAICMELLTPRGWASAYTVEAVIMQFAASLVKGQGRIARKQKGTKEFSRRSAEESFRSLVKTHEKYGWVTPPLADG